MNCLYSTRRLTLIPDGWSANVTLGLLQGCPSITRDERYPVTLQETNT